MDCVTKQFGATTAVAPTNLTINRGEQVALLGPSGSGITTLLLMLCGQTQPTAGNIFINSRNLSNIRAGKDLANQVGMIHQQFDLIPQLSALYNVLAGRLGHWGTMKSLLSLFWPLDKELALSALRRVGVVEKAEIRAGFLSGGEQQRIAIARLLLQNPAVILADEPVASLDPTRAREIIQLLVDIATEAERTLVASIHSVDLASRYFSRLIGIRNGAIKFDIPAKQITESMLDELYNLDGLRQ